MSRPQPLPILDYAKPSPSGTALDPDAKIVSGNPAPDPSVSRTAAIDPLSPLKAMTEEEIIALFS